MIAFHFELSVRDTLCNDCRTIRPLALEVIDRLLDVGEAVHTPEFPAREIHRRAQISLPNLSYEPAASNADASAP
jgi:hypothetical protein